MGCKQDLIQSCPIIKPFILTRIWPEHAVKNSKKLLRRIKKLFIKDLERKVSCLRNCATQNLINIASYLETHIKQESKIRKGIIRLMEVTQNGVICILLEFKINFKINESSVLKNRACSYQKNVHVPEYAAIIVKNFPKYYFYASKKWGHKLFQILYMHILLYSARVHS